jgi:AcrR family transcriptional regulator
MPKTAAPATTSVRPYGGESPAQRLSRRREAFLDAGLQCFGTSGYRQATVRQLCKQAELTDRYFYASFDTMEDLLIAVYQREFDRLEQALVQTLSAARDLDDALRHIRDGLVAVIGMASDPRVARVCWLEVLGVSPRVDAVYSQCVARFADLILLVARQHLPGWRPEPTEARVMGVALVGAISQTITHWLLTGREASQDTLVQATSRVFEGLLLLIRDRSSARPTAPGTAAKV